MHAKTLVLRFGVGAGLVIFIQIFGHEIIVYVSISLALFGSLGSWIIWI